MRFRTLPVLLAFLAMGFGDAVGPFVSLAKNEFQTMGLSVIPLGMLNAAFGSDSFGRFLLTVPLIGAGAATLQIPVVAARSCGGSLHRWNRHCQSPRDGLRVCGYFTWFHKVREGGSF